MTDKELTRTTTQDQKVLFGELEFTRLIITLIRVYRFRNSNQTPIAVVMPDVKEVEGVMVEFPKPKKEVKDD